jgi:hypothetical protein
LEHLRSGVDAAGGQEYFLLFPTCLRRLGHVIALTMRFAMRERPPAPVGSNPSQLDMRDWRRSERMLHGGGASRKVKALADGLCRLNSEFESMWRDYDVCTRGEGTKYVRHPTVGPIPPEYHAVCFRSFD